MYLVTEAKEGISWRNGVLAGGGKKPKEWKHSDSGTMALV